MREQGGRTRERGGGVVGGGGGAVGVGGGGAVGVGGGWSSGPRWGVCRRGAVVGKATRCSF